ncbi:hypothetical protein ATE92_2065 [Ulvibacter sp. MAR_2010_11]|uniref:hypothetical protein n=1 Tax=Ulvibacter sp. MAR_2010_11 TaxID=1250229 RepID=UPI000C2B8E0B|nr:hypothetical protein [Ulvibacter sp. MAR_2010_11]PKA83896.1 hypothetical protein ATE92_2065 [Ulvibacter sp. MAR_2010_11]
MKQLLPFSIYFISVFTAFSQAVDYEKLDSITSNISLMQQSANNFGFVENDKIYSLGFPEDNFHLYIHNLLATHAVYKTNNGKELLFLTEKIDITKANHIVYGNLTPDLLYIHLYFPDDLIKTKVFENGEIVDFLHLKYIEFYKSVENNISAVSNITALYGLLQKASGKITEEVLSQERKDWDQLTLAAYQEKYPNWIQIIEGKPKKVKAEVVASNPGNVENFMDFMYFKEYRLGLTEDEVKKTYPAFKRVYKTKNETDETFDYSIARKDNVYQGDLIGFYIKNNRTIGYYATIFGVFDRIVYTDESALAKVNEIKSDLIAKLGFEPTEKITETPTAGYISNTMTTYVWEKNDKMIALYYSKLVNAAGGDYFYFMISSIDQNLAR